MDNANIENFFSHLKTECLYLYKFKILEKWRKLLSDYIKFYNEERIQVNYPLPTLRLEVGASKVIAPNGTKFT
ncbi:MAG: IS3 family transposase [Tepidibacillus sp.]